MNSEDRLEDKRDMVIESVEADMEELDIHREDAHDRKKQRKYVIKRKSNTIGKRTINRLYIYIIYIMHIIFN